MFILFTTLRFLYNKVSARNMPLNLKLQLFLADVKEGLLSFDLIKNSVQFLVIVSLEMSTIFAQCLFTKKLTLSHST